MYIYIFFIHSSIDGHLGCFLVLAIVNNVLWDRNKDTDVLNGLEDAGREKCKLG